MGTRLLHDEVGVLDIEVHVGPAETGELAAWAAVHSKRHHKGRRVAVRSQSRTSPMNGTIRFEGSR